MISWTGPSITAAILASPTTNVGFQVELLQTHLDLQKKPVDANSSKEEKSTEQLEDLRETPEIWSYLFGVFTLKSYKAQFWGPPRCARRFFQDVVAAKLHDKSTVLN